MGSQKTETLLYQQASLTPSGRPIFLPNEIECHLLSGVDLDPEVNTYPSLKSGVLILTTHRLIWLPPSPSSSSLGPSTTTGGGGFSISLSAITHIFSSTKKSIKSMFASPRIRFQASTADSKSVVITIVVRVKGDFDGFLEKFWDCWKGKAWEVNVVEETSLASRLESGSGSKGGMYGSDGAVRMVGVTGILRKEQEMWENTDKTMQEAFQDLNALMIDSFSVLGIPDSSVVEERDYNYKRKFKKAKDMVILAERMRQKLLSGSNSQAGEEEMGSKEEIQEWMLSVGIVSPVTKESAGALYHQQLSRQLADFVTIPLEKAGGMINLIDIYCVFNRARGTELISPDDLLQACTLWQKFDVPVMLRKFDSGVMVIQSKSHSDEEVFTRIKALVTKPEALRTGISASDAAMTLGIAPAMAKEHLLNAEIKGLLCREISPDGFRFYINLFPELNPQDVYAIVNARNGACFKLCGQEGSERLWSIQYMDSGYLCFWLNAATSAYRLSKHKAGNQLINGRLLKGSPAPVRFFFPAWVSVILFTLAHCLGKLGQVKWVESSWQ
ncbi:hypothetical protein ACFE04_003691 [Oxalis oulophora]